jgi:hypothetical protein
MRQLTFDEFAQLAPAFDEFGRQNLLRDRVAARIGYANADRYVQKPTAEARPLIDEKFANLENNTLRQGTPLPMYPNDNHTIHARTHLAALSEGVAGIQEGPSDMVAVLPGLVALLDHTSAHVEAQSADPTVKEEAAANRRILSQLSEIVTNGAKHVEKLQREAGANQSQPSATSGPDSKTLAEIERGQVKIELMKQEAQAKREIRVADAAQERALKDAEYAQKLASRV